MNIQNTPVFTRHDGIIVQILNLDGNTCTLWKVYKADFQIIDVGELSLDNVTIQLSEIYNPTVENKKRALEILEMAGFPVTVTT